MDALTGKRVALRACFYRFDSEAVRSGGSALTIVGGNEEVRRPFSGAGDMNVCSRVCKRRKGVSKNSGPVLNLFSPQYDLFQQSLPYRLSSLQNCLARFGDGFYFGRPRPASSIRDDVFDELRTNLQKSRLLPVMAATPEFVDKNPQAVIEYLRAWLDVGKQLKENPRKAQDVIYGFFTSKGYTMSRETLGKAMANVEVDVGFPSDVRPYLQPIAEGLLKEKKIGAIPDWNKALRTEFMAKARA